ncbi:MAG: hypothetical protein IPI30_05830 [Saprospiraceae bacterium]|nr:hypothetical protein [Candidatus Vicinibacter affinis]
MNTNNSNPQKSLSDPESKCSDICEDYYLENGFVVFTAVYHLRRGYCCRSGCRHCPYKTGKD